MQTILEGEEQKANSGGGVSYSENAGNFRKKPVTIEAMKFTNETKDQVFNWITCNRYADFNLAKEPILRIETLEGEHRADLGDWIIKGVKGEFYPCKPDIFEMTYEKVE